MRRALAPVVCLFGLVFAPAAAAAGSVQLVAGQNPVRYDRAVLLTAVATPEDATAPREGLTVEIVRADGHVAASGVTDPEGTFATRVPVRRSVAYVARVQFPDGAGPTESTELRIRVRPIIRWRVYGSRVVGSTLVLRGYVKPAVAGTASLRIWGETRRLRLSDAGWFRKELATRTVAVLRGTVRLTPADGYTLATRSLAVPLERPTLGPGSRGVAVRALERRLRALHYVLRSVDTSFTTSTYQAVVAFQKVHRMARTGRVTDAVWTAVTRAGVPRARIPRGTHIEVDKTRQVMFEVVRGEVTRVVHVSTGATGNTPVGDWRSYRLGPGGSLSGMYYSIYFLRGFAIHGYHSVPNWPASHGCVRTPLWFAPGFYARWGRIGVRIVVFP
ncbi:MAG: L,D-transpeptidase family protein [Actinobacteria bacterium]|nr:L,D-transpeptidase family protein [Actinomycetota bacterium]